VLDERRPTRIARLPCTHGLCRPRHSLASDPDASRNQDHRRSRSRRPRVPALSPSIPAKQVRDPDHLASTDRPLPARVIQMGRIDIGARPAVRRRHTAPAHMEGAENARPGARHPLDRPAPAMGAFPQNRSAFGSLPTPGGAAAPRGLRPHAPPAAQAQGVELAGLRVF